MGGKEMHEPALTSKSASRCHLSVATTQRTSPSPSSFASPGACCRRQLRSITSFSLSPPNASSTPCSRSMENLPLGNR